jgi:hypothetical protein
MQLDTNKLRSTYIKGKKAYFVSDIVENFGESPVTKLTKNKAIFTSRVKWNNNSQTRRLVLHKDLVNTNVSTPEVKAPKAEIIRKPVTTVAEIRKMIGSAEEEKNRMLKARINKLCRSYSNRQIASKGVTKKDISENERWDYREAYLTMYSAFDRYMRAEINKRNVELRTPGAHPSLEELGLGYAKNTDNTSYIDRIAACGQLETLFAVAQALFEQK